MKINLESLARPKNLLVPVLNKTFQYHKKKYQIETSDGWWIVSIDGNKVTPVEEFNWIDENILPECENKKFKFVRGYTHNNQFVFQNFDAAKRVFDVGFTVPLHFNTVDSFCPVVVVAWESNQFFYAMPNYSETKVAEVKLAFDNEEDIRDIKGVTPEIRTLYLFHALERDQLRELLRQQHAKEEHEKMMRETPYRLKITLERAGAKLLNYSTSGDKIIIDWELMDGKFKYNSVIDSKNWMVREAGFCVSGEDKKFNITGMVQTADDYENRGVTFITRH